MSSENNCANDDVYVLDNKSISNKIPFEFNSTNIRVYSIEELVYHTKKYPVKTKYDIEHSNSFGAWLYNVVDSEYIENSNNSIYSILLYNGYTSKDEILKTNDILENSSKINEVELIKNEANNLLKNKKYKKAYSKYREIVNIANTVDVYNNLAISCINLSLYSDAIEYFEKGLRLCDEVQKKAVYINIIKLYLYKEMYDDAEKYIIEFEKNINDSENSELLLCKAQLYNNKGEIAESIRLYEKSIDILASEKSINKYVKAMINARKYDDAIKYINTLNVIDYVKKINIAKVEESNENIPEAIKILESIDDDKLKNEQKIYVYTCLSRLYSKNIEHSKSIEYVKKAQNIRNSNNNIGLLVQIANINNIQGNRDVYEHTIDKILNIYKKKYS